MSKKGFLKQLIPSDLGLFESYVPADKPPTSYLGSVIALLIFLTGIIIGITHGNHGFIFLGITVCMFIFMLDSGRELNYRLRKYGQIEADYVAGLIVGGFVVLINMYLITFIYFTLQFPLNLFITLLTTLFYEYLLLILLRARVDTETIQVQKEPGKPTDRFYIFTEDKYISLVEENALQKQSQSSNPNSSQ